MHTERETYAMALILLERRRRWCERLADDAHKAWQEAQGAGGTLVAWTNAITEATEAASAVYYLTLMMEDADDIEVMPHDATAEEAMYGNRNDNGDPGAGM